jgi:hypothetical protein
MSQLDTLARQVSQKIRARGRDYFERHAVKILFADHEFVSAQVSGSQDYEVDLERDRDELIVSCDCPYFEENLEVCKHVWATLLELEKQGHLKRWRARFPLKLVSTSSDDDGIDEDLEEFDFEDENAFFDGRETGTTFHPSAESPESLPSRSWQHLLNRMNWAPGPETRPPSWSAGREILYVIEQSRNLDSALALQINIRDRKKNGEWGKQKPLSLSHEMLSELPVPEDREILARLIGIKRETWFYGPYESIYRFVPRAGDLKILLPLISQTNRLYFRTSEMDDIRPLHWDEGGPWEFQIDVHPDAQGRQYEISGAFCRRSERLNIDQPEHVFSEGILVLDETIAAFHGSHDWVSFFRNEGCLFVPQKEADQWLETMLGMPSLPFMNLPEELRLQEIAATPRPIVRVGTKKETWGFSYLAGEILFDYMGHIVEERDPATGIALVPERRRILRNPEFEIAAIQKIEQVGFKTRRDYRSGETWTISQARLPAAVRDLVHEGWHVEAEGKLFRNPDSISLHISSGIDWFDLHGTVEYGGSRLPIPRLLAALKRHENTVLLDDGSFGMLPEEWMEQYGMLAGLGTTQGNHIRFKRHQAGLLDALLASQPETSCDEVFDRLRNELRNFTGIAPAPPPPDFRGSLRTYQQEGLGWLHFLQRFGFGGCLADDMGLGKTIQILSLLEERRSQRETNGSGGSIPPSLVVMPRSLVFNWLREAEHFTPKLRILEHTGGERIRGHEHFDDYDAVFTTYGTLRRDAPFFKEKVFDYVILDEAQAIKNSSTESAKAARLLRSHHRLALSGTPIENHIGELWSIFEFLNPGMLGSASALGQGKGTTGNIDEIQRPILARALRPFILRRTKEQVAQDLPAKVEQTLFCRLETPQRTLYNELRDHYRLSLLRHIEAEGIEKSKIKILEALLRLRQAAIHPGLVDGARVQEPSAKLDMLLPQLAEVLDEGHKALVFSQFTSMLAILRDRLDKELIQYEYLDGQTRDRATPVERFQNDPNSKLFLISLKAGGLGLNLTAAEYVFLLDPWWNPAVEAQAIDRTHRIGQTRSVFAYRLIAQDTVEEKVLALQENKRDIADAIINQDNGLIRNLRPDDLEILLS